MMRLRSPKRMCVEILCVFVRKLVPLGSMELAPSWENVQNVLYTMMKRKHIMRKAELDESQVGIKTDGRNINNLRYADDTTLMAESEEELKSLLMRVKEESTEVGLKLNIKKTKIMASCPLISWQIDGEEMEEVTDFIFLGSKISADGDCSQEIKRRLLLRRKAMANLDSLKSRDITLTTKTKITIFAFEAVVVQLKLKLNPDKTEVLLVGGSSFGEGELNLVLNRVALPLRDKVRSLGVLLDPELSLEAQVTEVARSAFFQLQLIHQLCPYLEYDCLATVTHTLVTSRLDFCNMLYVGLPLKT
ncbi:putative uncharacterized transposon-derived protein F52C9.6, partial [Varanus komodoensis]